MPRKWTKKEEVAKRKELLNFYVKQNKTIGEIAKILKVGESTVYDRLLRLKIPVNRQNKKGFNNERNDVFIPQKFSEDLAEFIGILLGDGHLTPFQVSVTLGKKDEYDDYVIKLMNRLFKVKPKKIFTREGHIVIYLGSARLVKWFLAMGMVFNKVKYQVDFPEWIFQKKEFMAKAIRGFFDTDGSVYRLRHGVQFSYCNMSKPLLLSARKMLIELNFFPSKINNNKNIYLTRKSDLKRYFNEVGFGNKKHKKRFLKFINGCVA